VFSSDLVFLLKLCFYNLRCTCTWCKLHTNSFLVSTDHNGCELSSQAADKKGSRRRLRMTPKVEGSVSDSINILDKESWDFRFRLLSFVQVFCGNVCSPQPTQNLILNILLLVIPINWPKKCVVVYVVHMNTDISEIVKLDIFILASNLWAPQ